MRNQPDRDLERLYAAARQAETAAAPSFERLWRPAGEREWFFWWGLVAAADWLWRSRIWRRVECTQCRSQHENHRHG